MRRITFALGLLLLATTSLRGLPADNQVNALSGCCRQSDSYTSRWYRNEMSFDECRKSNDRDKESLFDESGFFWWNITTYFSQAGIYRSASVSLSQTTGIRFIGTQI